MTEDTTPELTMPEAKFALARLLLQTLQQFETASAWLNGRSRTHAGRPSNLNHGST